MPEDLRTLTGEQLEELAERISDTHVNEVLHALDNEKEKGIPSGKDWYGKNYQKFKQELSSALSDPALGDPKSAEYGMFDLMMAATSNGQKVELNLKLAAHTYQKWKAGGMESLSGMDIGAGREGDAIAADLTLIQSTADRLGGYQNMLAMCKTSPKLGELRQALGYTPAELSGNAIDTVPGSYVLGPKIGRFYANLSGNATELTVDRWHNRNMRQSMGTVAAVAESKVSGQAKKLVKFFESGKFEGERPVDQMMLDKAVWSKTDKKKQEKEYKSFPRTQEPDLHGFDASELVASAKRVEKQGHADWDEPVVQWAKRSSLEYARLDYGSIGTGLKKLKTKKRQLAHALYKNYSGVNDVPNPNQRRLAETAVKKALAKLQDMGHKDLNISSVQAILWIQTKRLYQQAGVGVKDSPTYSGALAKLIKENRLMVTQ